MCFEYTALRKKLKNVINYWSFIFDNWSNLINFVFHQKKLGFIRNRIYISVCFIDGNCLWFNNIGVAQR